LLLWLQTAMTAWAQLACKPLQGMDMAALSGRLQSVAGMLQSMAPLDSKFSSLDALAGSSRSSSRGASPTPPPPPPPPPPPGASQPPPYKPVTATYEQLMSRRVAELKRMLEERGISSAGCFEKSDLARLILERCTA
jgi:hypothetical protein